jgi:hypothetical protein
MSAFLKRFAPLVSGLLMGFDRVIFRGTLRNLSYPAGLQHYLWANRIPYKDFHDHSEEVTQRLIEASQREASASQREIRYLERSSDSKEDTVREIIERDQVKDGLICVLRCVEPCMSFQINKSQQTGKLEIRYRPRQCLHLYHYQFDPLFGYLFVRLQTWFPFGIQIYLNGREWLARQMDRVGLGYQRRDNSFTWLQDVAKAQGLMDEQTQAAWPQLLDTLARRVNPIHDAIFKNYRTRYYWSVKESEYATDVLFRKRAELEKFHQRLVRHGITTYGAEDVLRFLGRRIAPGGKVPPQFQGEVLTDVKTREVGTRIRHSVNANSIKAYDKGPNLRVEVTINNPNEFQVYRPTEQAPEGPKDWRPMRRGVVDMARRVRVSQAATDRYLKAATAMTDEQPLRELAEPVCQRALAPLSTRNKRPGKSRGKVRALNPLSQEDATLLQAANNPKFVQNGLRNQDLCQLLYPEQASNDEEGRRRSAKTTRLLRLLRAHGLIKKVPKTHRYQVTPRGRITMTALLAARDASTDALTKSAA